MKSAARRILGPIARPLLWRMRRFSGLRAEVDELRAVLPAVVNAATSVAAIGHEQARMRRETEKALAEMRESLSRLHGPSGPRIVSADKVAAARAAGVKLHLGFASNPREGYLHVDAQDAPGVDIVAQWDALPFGPGEVEEICSWHVLEHVTPPEAQRLLSYWATLLRPAGRLCAVVIDGRAVTGASPVRHLFTADSLAATFASAGLVDVHTVAEAHGKPGAWQLEVAARAPR